MNIGVDSEFSSQRLGRSLRALRLARRWTLQDFERASGGRIKAVVLGSYERASRSVAFSKLEEIAGIYQVPISALLAPVNNGQSSSPGHIVIDLRKLREILTYTPSINVTNLNLLICGIIDFRKDWNGEILSLRNSDLNFIAMICSTNVENITKEYAQLKLLFESKD